MTVYIVDIEPVETRYTAQWKKYLPQQMQDFLKTDVVVISGGETPQATTPGAFLNFGGTNVYKSNQLMQIGEMFCNGTVKDGDYFLYTDAWNPTVIQLRYMAELLGVNIRVGGLWHAGSYDPQDFLGRLIGDKPWVRRAEQSMFACFDDNFFATEFHYELFDQAHGEHLEAWDSAYKRAGWPMEYLQHELAEYSNLQKEDIIIFPHRVAPEKQPEIFKDLAEAMPQYEFVIAQERNLTKHEYHTLLGKSKMMFSANHQETLGISWYEAALVNTTPIVPDRLSYSEMAKATPDVLYPSEWTQDWESYQKNKHLLINFIDNIMKKDNKNLNKSVADNLTDRWFSGETLYRFIRQSTA